MLVLGQINNEYRKVYIHMVLMFVLGLDNVWIYFGLWLSYVGSAGPSDVSVVQINNECSNVGSGIVWLILVVHQISTILGWIITISKSCWSRRWLYLD